MESNDLSTIKSAQEDLTRTSHKLAEAMYAKTSAKAGGPGPQAQAGAESGGQKSQEDVVEAEYEDVSKK